MSKYSKSWRDFKPSKKIKIINKIFRKDRQLRSDDYLVGYDLATGKDKTFIY